MANPEGKVAYSVELEFDDDAKYLKSGRFEFTFKMTNSGRRAAEEMLGISYQALQYRLEIGRIGSSETTALLFAATRKFHARRLPNVEACDEFMDALIDTAQDDEDGDAFLDLQVALLAANRRTTITEMRKILRLDETSETDEGEATDEAEDEDDEGDGGEADSGPKDVAQGEGQAETENSEKPEKPRPARAASKTGKSSSTKRSSAAST